MTRALEEENTICTLSASELRVFNPREQRAAGTKQGWKQEYKSTSVSEAPLSTLVYVPGEKIKYFDLKQFHSFRVSS